METHTHTHGDSIYHASIASRSKNEMQTLYDLPEYVCVGSQKQIYFNFSLNPNCQISIISHQNGQYDVISKNLSSNLLNKVKVSQSNVVYALCYAQITYTVHVYAD